MAKEVFVRPEMTMQYFFLLMIIMHIEMFSNNLMVRNATVWHCINAVS